MRAHTLTYLLSFILLLCTPYWGGMEVHAQRAKKHREGILTTDSIRLKHQADSLALADTTDLQRQLNLKNLEAPVDTAALAQQNDSLQHAQPQPIEKKTLDPQFQQDSMVRIGHPRGRTDLQPEILEVTHHLWRFCGLCLRPYMEQPDVQGLFAGLSGHNEQQSEQQKLRKLPSSWNQCK